MAKNPGPGFFDKHIEKVVTAVCAVIALVAILYYGVSTPLRLEVPTGQGRQVKAVEPSEVDVSLYQASKRLETKITSIKAPPIERRKDVVQLKELQEFPIAGQKMASIDFGTPMVKGKTRKGVGRRKTRAVTIENMVKVMPKPSKPFSWTGVELLGVQEFTGDEEAAEGQLREDPVWRGVAYYPKKELANKWADALEDTVVVPQVVVVGYEVEIQEQRPNGKWVTIEDVQPFKMPETAKNKKAQAPVIPDFVINEKGESNLEEVRKAITEVDTWMFVKLQPDYFQVWTKDGKISWQQHMPLEKIRSIYKSEEIKPSTPVKPTVGRARRTLDSRIAAMPMGPEGMGMMPPQMAGRMPTRRSPGRRMGNTAGNILPSQNEQIAAGKPMAWFHINNIQFGKKYRCRFRWIFVNPLLTYVKSVDQKKLDDAYAKKVESPWSDWSDPISVNRKMGFFITGSNVQKKELTVTVFTEVLGQLVRAKFDRIGVGKGIGGNADVSVVNPATGTRQKMRLKFDTGAVVVNINFNRRLITKAGRIKKDAVEMIYADANGDVHGRVMYNDKNSPEFLAMTDEAQRGEPERERPDTLNKKDKRSSKDKKSDRRTKMMPPMMPGGMGPDMMPPTRGKKSSRRGGGVRFD